MTTIHGVDLHAHLSTDARAFADALSELVRVVQFRDRDRACCYDVSASQCYALETVTDCGPLTVNDLAAELYLDKSTASRLAAGLEAKGYLSRERAPEDGRVVHLVSTEAGRVLRERIEYDTVRQYEELLADFDPEVRPELTRLVERLAEAFSARVDVSGGSCCVVTNNQNTPGGTSE